MRMLHGSGNGALIEMTKRELAAIYGAVSLVCRVNGAADTSRAAETLLLRIKPTLIGVAPSALLSVALEPEDFDLVSHALSRIGEYMPLSDFPFRLGIRDANELNELQRHLSSVRPPPNSGPTASS